MSDFKYNMTNDCERISSTAIVFYGSTGKIKNISG